MYPGGTLVSVSALAAGLCAGACSTAGGRQTGTGALRPAPRPYAADIPLADGFKLVDKSSEDWASASVRYVRHKYVGRAAQGALREFYRAEMPLVRWTALSDSLVQGKRRMRFVRGNEECIVEIADERGLLSGRAAVEVTITPTRADGGGGAPHGDAAAVRRGDHERTGQQKGPE